jgi:hypothetical protein
MNELPTETQSCTSLVMYNSKNLLYISLQLVTCLIIVIAMVTLYTNGTIS